MLSIRYSDPPGSDTAGGNQQKSNYDITNYVQKYTWSGDSEQAARKLEFAIAYNTPDKDKVFVPLDLKLGGYIYLYYRENEKAGEIEIFRGRIFYRKRSSDGYTFEFACFDDLIYLAKSNIRAIIAGTAKAGIEQILNEIGIQAGNIPAELNVKVDFIADDKSGTETIRMILDQQQAADAATGQNTHYLPVCINGKVSIIKKGELIEGYTAAADTNVFGAEHSESIEDMVNSIKAVDDNGTVCQVFANEDDVNRFGMIQKIYKMQPPKPNETVDNTAAAKAQLVRQKDESSLKGVGYVQCITGYSINVQEEQLKGKFYIKSDTHSFENNTHTMELTLEYIAEG